MKFKLILCLGIFLPFLALAQNFSDELVAIKKLISARQYDIAVSRATQILNLEENPDAYYLRALALSYSNPKSAETDVNKAIELKADGSYYLLRAKVYRQAKNFNAEIADYQKALSLREDSTTRLYMARAYVAIKDSSAAKRTVELNLKLHPDHIASYVYLSVLAGMHKDNDLAIKILNDAYETHKSPLLLISRAQEYRKQGKYEQALLDYETLISKYKSFHLLFVTAQCASEAGDYKKTIEYYKQYLEQNPNSSAALSNAGQELQKIGNFKEAEAYYRKSLELSPKNPFPLGGQALIAYKKGNVEEAFSLIDASLLFKSKFKVSKIIRGFLNTYEGNLDDAEADFKDALTDPQQKKYAERALAKVYIYKGEYSKAVDFATQSIEGQRTPSPDIYNTRGFAYYKMGKFDESVKDFFSAMALGDNYQPIFNYLKKDSKQPLDDYLYMQFLTPLNDVNDSKIAYYTDGEKDFNFKVRVISKDEVDADKIKIYERGQVLDQKYWILKNVEQRNFKLMGMLVTDIAFKYMPKSKRSLLKLTYGETETQTLTLIK